MSVSMLFGETELSIAINTLDYETNTGFDISTNTDLIFMLKSAQTAADVDAEYSIVAGADLSYSSNVITAKINDWGSLVVATEYYIGVGFKLSGDANYREIPLTKATQTIVFKQDTVRA